MDKTDQDYTQIAVCNLGDSPIDYTVTSTNPLQEPISGDLPPKSYGILSVRFALTFTVVAGGGEVQIGPDGLAAWVPAGPGGLIGTYELSGPAPPA